MYQQNQVNPRENVRITVFTPAYNRGYIIENLYHSLQRQTYRNFEWLVVDDGSQDDTGERFQRMMADENDFPIRYIRQENGGKHRAINAGVTEARGELFLIVDSDDYLTDDALEELDKVEKSIPAEEKDSFGGVCGLKVYDTNRIIGTTFEGDTLDITMLQRSAYGITGDKAEAFYTQIMRRYPFPEFPGENFLTECVVWDRIAADGFKLRFYNHNTIICNYLEDGLTKNLDHLILYNPRGQALYLRQSVAFGRLKGVEKCNAYVGFYESLRTQYTFSEIAEYLQMDPVKLRFSLLCMRIYRRMLER